MTVASCNVYWSSTKPHIWWRAKLTYVSKCICMYEWLCELLVFSYTGQKTRDIFGLFLRFYRVWLLNGYFFGYVYVFTHGVNRTIDFFLFFDSFLLVPFGFYALLFLYLYTRKREVDRVVYYLYFSLPILQKNMRQFTRNFSRNFDCISEQKNIYLQARVS